MDQLNVGGDGKYIWNVYIFFSSHFSLHFEKLLFYFSCNNFSDKLPDLDDDWQFPCAQPTKYTHSACPAEIIEILDEEEVPGACGRDNINIPSSSELEGNMYNFDDPFIECENDVELNQEANTGEK